MLPTEMILVKFWSAFRPSSSQSLLSIGELGFIDQHGHLDSFVLGRLRRQKTSCRSILSSISIVNAHSVEQKSMGSSFIDLKNSPSAASFNAYFADV